MPDTITIEQFREAVNSSCTCGGGGPDEGCPACQVWHKIVAEYHPDQLSENIGRCEDCYYWDASTTSIVDEDKSPCRINPPIPLISGDSVWPFTESNEWCGKWRKR